jgi:hypothetical protein
MSEQITDQMPPAEIWRRALGYGVGDRVELLLPNGRTLAANVVDLVMVHQQSDPAMPVGAGMVVAVRLSPLEGYAPGTELVVPWSAALIVTNQMEAGARYDHPTQPHKHATDYEADTCEICFPSTRAGAAQ